MRKSDKINVKHFRESRANSVSWSEWHDNTHNVTESIIYQRQKLTFSKNKTLKKAVLLTCKWSVNCLIYCFPYEKEVTYPCNQNTWIKWRPKNASSETASFNLNAKLRSLFKIIECTVTFGIVYLQFFKTSRTLYQDVSPTWFRRRDVSPRTFHPRDVSPTTSFTRSATFLHVATECTAQLLVRFSHT
jgi:hypothetical protein